MNIYSKKKIDSIISFSKLNYPNRVLISKLKEKIDNFFGTFECLFPNISKSDLKIKNFIVEMNKSLKEEINNYIISWNSDLKPKVINMTNYDELTNELIISEVENIIITMFDDFISSLCDNVIIHKILKDSENQSIILYEKIFEKSFNITNEEFNIKSLFVIKIEFITETSEMNGTITDEYSIVSPYSKIDILKFKNLGFDNDIQEEIIGKVKKFLETNEE